MRRGAQNPMLSNRLLDNLVAIAEHRVPHEMCGLLFSADVFISCQNTAARPEHEFNIEHSEYEWVCRIVGKTPIGIVHSHPGRSARLSVKDCSLLDALQMAKMAMDMVIVGLEPVEVKCWRKVGELYHLEWEWKHDATRAVLV